MVRTRLDGLDGLRGIAAAAVLLSHVYPDVPFRGYLAVDFFFMLSGYVMARRYEPALVAGGWRSARPFLAARLRRLYPTVVMASLLGLPWLFAEAGGAAPTLAVATLLLIPWDGPTGPYMLNPPMWSIAFELLANLVHALLLARLGIRPLLLLAAGVMLMLALAVGSHGLDLVPSAGNRALVAMRTIAPYAIGVVLYRRWRDRPPVRLGAVATWALMPLAFAAAALLPAPGHGADFLFVLLACPLLIAGGLTHGRGSRVARAAGALSFPLYAVHGPVVLSLKSMGFGAALQIATAVAAAIVLLGLTRLSWRPSVSRRSLAA